MSIPNADRFSGFADVYDANRPQPPDALGPLLRRYAGAGAPAVVDLGSGSGLSTRWAATWAAHVTGVEPSDDMRAQAERRGGAGITYRAGTAETTGLPDAYADVVTAVQAMHWMEPVATLAEVDRLLRPGGVFATIDADWPPVAGVPAAEAAWGALHRTMRVLEARRARDVSDHELRAPIADDGPALVDEDLRDPHRNRLIPGGVRSWSKREHLANIERSGHFTFTRELAFAQSVVVDDAAERFVALMRSQGSYQGLRRAGLTDADMGADAFESSVRAAFSASAEPVTELAFSWRVRLGVKAR